MPESAPDFGIILDTLTRHEVDFIVVGGVCAVLLGAPVTTFDLDIVHSRKKDNLEKLNTAFESIDAIIEAINRVSIEWHLLKLFGMPNFSNLSPCFNPGFH